LGSLFVASYLTLYVSRCIFLLHNLWSDPMENSSIASNGRAMLSHIVVGFNWQQAVSPAVA
jgi:hypothetical protein